MSCAIPPPSQLLGRRVDGDQKRGKIREIEKELQIGLKREIESLESGEVILRRSAATLPGELASPARTPTMFSKCSALDIRHVSLVDKHSKSTTVSKIKVRVRGDVTIQRAAGGETQKG